MSIDIKLGNCPFCGDPATWCGNESDEPHSCHIIHCGKCDINFDMCAIGQGPTDEDETDPLRPLLDYCAYKFNSYEDDQHRIAELEEVDKISVNYIKLQSDRITELEAWVEKVKSMQEDMTASNALKSI